MANILVVDDDDNMRRLIRTILERRGHQVTEARDGLDGLARFDESRADLVVTDMVMPGIGGLAFLAELQGRQSPPKVLVVSGKRAEPDGALLEFATRGIIGFMGKPFTPVELSESVQALLG
jgi:two-component system, chemotaxis family, chemotaxis protein CheY